MSTRATIKFEDDYNTFHVHRSHDGFPDIIIPDIEETIKNSEDKWNGPEAELLVTLFLAMHWQWDKNTLPYYEITSGIHGDESYLFSVKWNRETKKWDISEEALNRI
jgi:hypothetical protein